MKISYLFLSSLFHSFLQYCLYSYWNLHHLVPSSHVFCVYKYQDHSGMFLKYSTELSIAISIFIALLFIFAGNIPPPCSLWQNIECWSISGWSESDRGRPPPPPAKPNQLVSRVWNILSSGHFYFWKWEIILYYMNIYLISLKKGKVWGKFQNRLDPSPQIYLKLSNFQKILPPPPTWIKVRIF